MTNTKSVQLQSIGSCPATEAQYAQVGDYRVYNFGYLAKIINITAVTSKTLELETEDSHGRLYKKKMRKTTPIVLGDSTGKFITRTGGNDNDTI